MAMKNTVEPNDKSTKNLPAASVNSEPTRKSPADQVRIEGERKA